MAAPYFYNPFDYPILVPTPSAAGVELYPGEIVQGSYYRWLLYDGLLAEYVGTPLPQQVVYIYPENVNDGPGITPDSPVNSIIAGTGITAVNDNGDVTVGIADEGVDTLQIADGAVTTNKLAIDAAVISLNDLTEAVELIEGTNVVITTDDQVDPKTIEISVPTIDTFDSPTTIDTTVTLGGNSSFVGTYVGASSTDPAISLTGSANTVPMIKLKGMDALADCIEIFDNNDNSTFKVTSDGTVSAANLLFSRMALMGSIVTAGNYTISVLSSSSFACDCTSGTVTFTLPLLDQTYPSGTVFVFIKTDAGANTILLSPSGGQTINGLSSKTITTQYVPVMLMAFTSVSQNFWLVI